MQVVIVFLCVSFVVLLIVLFILVKRLKSKTAQVEILEKENQKMKSDIQFQEEKKQIMQEVFEDAKDKKESIHTGTDSQRYNAAASILHNNKRN